MAAAAFYDLDGTLCRTNLVHAFAYNARNQLLKYVTAGDPPLYRVGDQGTTEGDFTLEELMVTMRRVTSKAS